MIDFAKEVIDASREKAVVVDFWAPWCAPCRVLGPVIEEIASEQKELWSLVKVNTEEQPELAMQYQIRGIPNVKMFYHGDVIAEFAGALPKTQILAWLQEHLPTEEKDNWHTLQDELSSMESTRAQIALEAFLDNFPDHHEARVALAKLIALDEPAKAMSLVAQIKMGHQDYDLVQDLHTYTELISLEDQSKDPVDQLLIQAQKEIATKQFDSGLEHLIAAVQKDKTKYDELPRRAAIAVFHLLGSKHPATLKYRRQFDMALY